MPADEQRERMRSMRRLVSEFKAAVDAFEGERVRLDVLARLA
jgi:hypothetical protein